jgi:hypothetical protein
MKKLIVLVSALLLVSMAAVASDVTLTGEVETRWLHDFTNKAFQQGPEVIVGVNATVDENASVYIELEEGPRAEFAATSAATFDFDKAYFTLDLGGIFDLPVGVTVRTGFDEYDTFDAVKVTFGEWEDVIGTDSHSWGHEVNIAATEQVAIRVLWANDFGLKDFAAGVASLTILSMLKPVTSTTVRIWARATSKPVSSSVWMLLMVSPSRRPLRSISTWKTRSPETPTGLSARPLPERTTTWLLWALPLRE